MAFRVPEEYRIRRGRWASDERDGNNGAFGWRMTAGGTLTPTLSQGERGTPGGVWFWAVASDGLGWEHVSVHVSCDLRGRQTRTPSWDEMCAVKQLFWDREDVVMELHPPGSEYVDYHPHTLHLWRPVGVEVPRPPAVLVGPGGQGSGASGDLTTKAPRRHEGTKERPERVRR